MKNQGCSIIFLNSKNQILLFLRDDIPQIKYPGMWDLPGGHVEKHETPEECIVREMKEEIEMELSEFELFTVTDFPDRVENTFFKRIELNINEINLHEGQRLAWFSVCEIKQMKLAFNFNQVINEFADKMGLN